MPQLDPKEEQIIFNTLRDEQSRIEKMSVIASPELSARIGSIYKKNPAMPAGVVLASAQAGLPDEIVDQMGNQFAEQKIRDAELGKPKKPKNWFQRNVYDKFKTATRYMFAGLELPVQTIQGGAAQLFADNPDGIDGWFASTDLGSLIKNDELAGEGFFLGGEAKTLQQQRVEAYRGKTTGGQAWTIGRGLAGVVSTEDSLAYNLMSGLVDGAIAVSVPVLPGFKQAAGAVKAAEEAGKGGKFIRGADVAFDTIRGKGTAIRMSEMTGEQLKALRLEAGLANQTIDPSVANKWMGTEKYRTIRERLVNANTIDDVRKLVGDKVYVSTAQRLRDATSPEAIDEVMADILGVAQQGLTRTIMPGTRRFSVSNARRVKVIDSLVGAFEDTKAGRIASRAFEMRPMQNIIDWSSENETDVLRTVNDIDRWLKAALVKDTAETVVRNGEEIVMPGRVEFLDQVVNALSGPNATRTARKKAAERFQAMMKESLIRNGNNDAEVISAVFDYQKGWAKKTSNWHTGMNATIDDGGMYMGVHGEKTVAQGVFGGPTMQSDLADIVMEMPDIDQVRALTGRMNRVWRKRPNIDGMDVYEDDNIRRLAEAGRLRLPLAFVRNVQENVFRKIILATGGYAVRNIMEGQISLALSQRPVTSILRHPIQHMQWIAHDFALGRLGRLGIGDIMGEQWTDDVAIASMEKYRRATDQAVSSHYKDPTYILRRGQRTGDFKTVRRGVDEKAAIVSAHADQVGRMNADVVMRQLASGMNDDELIDFIRTTDEGKAWFRDQQDYHINGRHVFDTSGPTPRWAGTQSVDLNDEHNLRMLLQSYRNRYNLVVGSHDNVRIAVQTGLLEPKQLSAADVAKNGLRPEDAGTVKQIAIGNRVVDVRIDANDYTIVRPFAFRKGEMTPDLEELLGRTGPNGIFDDVNLAQEMVYESRVAQRVGRRGINEVWDDTMDKFFGFIAGKPIKFLERSPAFRQRYYAWAIDEMVTSLSPADLDAMILRIEDAAKAAGVTPSQYVGDHTQFTDIARRLFGGTQKPGDRWQRILNLQQNPSRLKATLTLEEIDEFAKGQALDDLSRMVYDATERSNLIDVGRFLVPFGQAQVEFFRRISRIYTVETGLVPLPNLSALRKTQLVVENGREADPDGNGRGFFFTDAQTGEWSFTYPFTDKLTHLATGALGGGPGVKSTFQAPVKGALMGLDVRPGLGPFAQIGATVMLRDQPTYDWARALFLPYGELDIAGNKGIGGTVIDALTPAYAKKLQSAFFDSPESQTTYGNTYFEVYQALAASGQYDLNDPEDTLRMADDTTGKARFLTVMRALGQYLGPSRPTNKLSVETKKGDVFVNLLAQDLRERQLQDYDTAISSWLDDYGEDVFVYLSGKTKAVAGGLTASSEFGKFERANKGFFKKYGAVAGFFAPGGTDLDWQVYSRQLETGQRERLTTDEALAAAQRYIAYKKYRSLQEFIGPYPNGEQRDYLARYREYLGELYPGFQYAAFDPNELRRRIEQLKVAANDPDVADNKVADAARRYLQARDAVYAEAAKGGLKSIERAKGAEQLRGYLREYASVLVKEVPEFERLYNQLLQQEVDE